MQIIKCLEHDCVKFSVGSHIILKKYAEPSITGVIDSIGDDEFCQEIKVKLDNSGDFITITVSEIEEIYEDFKMNEPVLIPTLSKHPLTEKEIAEQKRRDFVITILGVAGMIGFLILLVAIILLGIFMGNKFSVTSSFTFLSCATRLFFLVLAIIIDIFLIRNFIKGSFTVD